MGKATAIRGLGAGVIGKASGRGLGAGVIGKATAIRGLGAGASGRGLGAGVIGKASGRGLGAGVEGKARTIEEVDTNRAAVRKIRIDFLMKILLFGAQKCAR